MSWLFNENDGMGIYMILLGGVILLLASLIVVFIIVPPLVWSLLSLWRPNMPTRTKVYITVAIYSAWLCIMAAILK